LAAAASLELRGARVTVIEARARVGGRVWTLRDGFTGRQHAEAGADLIEEEQKHLRDWARSLGLAPVRILKDSFGFYGPDTRGRRRIQGGPGGFARAARWLAPQLRDFKLAESRWDSAVAARLAAMSVAEWLDKTDAPAALKVSMRAFRGFFLADPEDLSLLPVVEQLAEEGPPGRSRIFRVPGGNDAIATRAAARLRSPVRLETIVRRVERHHDRVVVAVDDAEGRRARIDADFFVCALPATTTRDVQFEPTLPEPQHTAIDRLRYGCATRLILQFERRFWRKRGRPNAFGTDLAVGAVWDGNEHQRGPRGILSCLAGGNASGLLQEILAEEGVEGAVRRLDWLGRASPLLASQVITWEHDPWARGGYAYFDPTFDPLWRAWLARPAGRIVFAGEHTSMKYQGYMNGAVESGQRAAAEISAIAART
jgi:monoamine oxidase